MTAAPTPAAQSVGSWPLYRALVGVGMVCGLLIVTVYVLTGPVIARNEAEALQQAVFQVLPGATRSAAFALDDSGRLVPAGADAAAGRTIYAGYDGDGALVGIAIPGQGMGYQDVIRLLFGYDPARQAIIGVQVLASKETPGLGDKIEKDPAFLANFEALDVAVAADGDTLANSIVAVKHGEKTQPWQIDGITGATISSKAVAAILRAGSAQWVPLLQRQQENLAAEGAHGGT